MEAGHGGAPLRRGTDVGHGGAGLGRTAGLEIGDRGPRAGPRTLLARRVPCARARDFLAPEPREHLPRRYPRER